MGISNDSSGSVMVFCDNPIDVLLYDYDINKAELKHNHRIWLANNIIKSLESRTTRSKYDSEFRVVVEGRASRTGTEKYNCDLSEKRAIKVSEVLKSLVRERGICINVSVVAVGESLSEYGDNTEFPIDRAVRIQFRERGAIQHRKIRVPEYKVFRLRVLKGNSYSASPAKTAAGLKYETLVFQVWDVKESTVANYDYSHKGRTVSVGLGLPISPDSTSKGKWNEFRAPYAMTADSFSGPARLDGSAGLTFIQSLSTGRDFHFGGLAENKWWQKPIYNFNIEDLDTGTSKEAAASIGLFDPDPFPGSFTLIEGSFETGFFGD